MILRKVKRLAWLRHQEKMATHEPFSRSVLHDYRIERLPEVPMFRGLKVGDIAVIDTFSFPIIGEVVEMDETSITLKNSVRVLYDGRHGEMVAGANSVPANAEIERTYPLYTVSADFVGGWGVYPGGKIPKAQ